MLWHAVTPLTSFVALLLTAPRGKDLSNLRLSNPNPQKPLRGQPPLSIIWRIYVRYITSYPRYYVVLNCLYYNISNITCFLTLLLKKLSGEAGFRPQSGYPNDLLSRQSRLLDSCSFQYWSTMSTNMRTRWTLLLCACINQSTNGTFIVVSQQ